MNTVRLATILGSLACFCHANSARAEVYIPQETADETWFHEGEDPPGGGWCDNVGNYWDNNWDTRGAAGSYQGCGGWCYWEERFYKPEGAVGARVKFKYYHVTDYYTIPESCWNYLPDRVIIEAYSVHQYGTATICASGGLKCKTGGSTWSMLTYESCESGANYIYESTLEWAYPWQCLDNTDCDDGVACTDDTCDVSHDCQFTPNDVHCNDGVGCTDDTCDATLDCQFTPDDGNCNDGVGCTDDTCHVTEDCQFTPNNVNCNDGVGCTDDTCDPVLDCQFTPNNANCDDEVDCTNDTCDATLDCQFAPDDDFCVDETFCDGQEVCNPAVGCEDGPLPDCSDARTCTFDFCDGATDTCAHTPVHGLCQDSDACTTDTCDPDTGDPVTGCKFTPITCDDEDVCTTDTCDPGSGCIFTPITCDDGIDCTDDTCDPIFGCQFDPDHSFCSVGDWCDGIEVCVADLGCESCSNPCPFTGCDPVGQQCVGQDDPIVFDWVTIGNAGNQGEPSGEGVVGGNGPDRVCGAVSYEYRIAKYEVTNEMYRRFLNAVAAEGDPNGLYNTDGYEGGMDGTYGGIVRCGAGTAEAPWMYTPKNPTTEAEWDSKPVNFVNWYNALRFANWLHNGQPTGGQDATTTEDGAYDLSLGGSVVREPDAKFFMPTEDEWYKAAFYDPRLESEGGPPGDDHYWLSATQCDGIPEREGPPGSNAICGSANYWDAVGQPYYMASVGSYTFKPSESAYGTFDQNGNVWEWNEDLIDYASFEWRVLRGGSWHTPIFFLPAPFRYAGDPGQSASEAGFRLATCDDGNICTADSWDEAIGCINNGTGITIACDDGDACMTDEVCQGDAAGTCQGTDTSAVDCDDGIACTTDTCDEITGCANTPLDAACDDSDVCTVGTCDPALGCLNDGTGITIACDDGNACTVDDACQGDGDGTCAGVFTDSDGDGVADACDPCPLDNPDDSDGDGVCSSDDNCPNHANPDQLSPLGPPLPDPLVLDDGFGTKNRYISFVPNNPGQQTAVRVTLTGLPVPYDTYDGLTMWVGAPVEVSENAGKVDPAEALGFPTFWAATLQCDAHYTDWSAFPVVYVYDETVVPSGVYDIQVVAETCDDASEGSYSAPLTVTQSQWGDVISDCGTTPCGPPDGIINVTTDVTSVLNKFKNLEGAPSKARSDLDMSLPDQKINISDVTLCLEAFGGFDYPFSPGPPPPPCEP